MVVAAQKAFLTGATGFVGANLARRLVNLGYDVHALIRSGANTWRLDSIIDRLRVHTGDLTDAAALEQTVCSVQPDIVYHLAVYGAYAYQNEAEKIFQTNINGTLHLLQACQRGGVAIVVNTGSSSEYGFKDQPMRETDWCEPNSYYAVAKASQTMLCHYWSQASGVPVITLRLFSVYGPWENPGRLIPTLVGSCLDGRDLQLVDPKIVRDFVYIDDVVDAYLAAATHPEYARNIFNVGSGRETSIKEAVAVLFKQLPTRSQARWGTMPNRAWDSQRWQADITKISSKLGWSPRYLFPDGIAATIAWFKNHKHFYKV